MFPRGFPSINFSLPSSSTLPRSLFFRRSLALSLASSWCNVPSRRLPGLVAGDNRSLSFQLPFLIIVPARSKMDSSNRGPWGSEGRGRTGGYHGSNKASRRLPTTIASDSHQVPSWSLFESLQDAPLYQRIDFYTVCYFYRQQCLILLSKILFYLTISFFF